MKTTILSLAGLDQLTLEWYKQTAPCENVTADWHGLRLKNYSFGGLMCLFNYDIFVQLIQINFHLQ